jgi:hypothetical protein
MNKALALFGIAVLALSAPVMAASSKAKHAKTAAHVVYECSKCHMKFSATQAKKDHYVDPMDGGKLVPVKTSAAHSKGSAKPMSGMHM